MPAAPALSRRPPRFCVKNDISKDFGLPGRPPLTSAPVLVRSDRLPRAGAGGADRLCRSGQDHVRDGSSLLPAARGRRGAGQDDVAGGRGERGGAGVARCRPAKAIAYQNGLAAFGISLPCSGPAMGRHAMTWDEIWSLRCSAWRWRFRRQAAGGRTRRSAAGAGRRCSRSVTEPKFKLQREGRRGHHGSRGPESHHVRRTDALPCFIEWATAGMTNVVIDWTLIGDQAARSFGDRLARCRSFAGSTSISSAIDFSVTPARARALPVGAADHRRFRRRQQLRPLGHRRPRRCPGQGHRHQRPGHPDAAFRIVPPRAHQSAGRPGEILPGQRHRRVRGVHRRGRRPSFLRSIPDQEADRRDRRPAAASARGRALEPFARCREM